MLSLCAPPLAVGCEPCNDSPRASIPADGGPIFFAINAIVVDPTDDPAVPHAGFDLDGLSSTDVEPGGCAHADFLSRLDPDQNCSAVSREHCTSHAQPCTCHSNNYGGCFGSVDNQLPTFANMSQLFWGEGLFSTVDHFRPQVRADVESTSNVILIELLDVDDLVTDDSIRIRLFRGFAAPGTPCAAASRSAVYQIDARSLVAGGTTSDAAAWSSTGNIVNGRIHMAGPSTQTLPTLWPLGPASSVELPTGNVQIAADIRGDDLTLGNFGGSINGGDLIDAIAMLAPDYVSVVRSIVGGLVDVQERGVCDWSSMSPPQYGGLSIGFGFTAIRVEIDTAHPVVSGPSPGSCRFGGTPDAGSDDATDG